MLVSLASLTFLTYLLKTLGCTYTMLTRRHGIKRGPIDSDENEWVFCFRFLCRICFMAARNWNSSEKRKLKGCFILKKLRKTVLLSNENMQKKKKKDLKSLQKGKKYKRSNKKINNLLYLCIYTKLKQKYNLYTVCRTKVTQI